MPRAPSRAPQKQTSAEVHMVQVPAITRGFSILRYLARTSESVGVQVCARELGIVPSTCFHILRALVNEDAVVFDPITKKYTLGLGLLTIASTVVRRKPQLRLLQHDLDSIAKRYGVTVVLGKIADAQRSIVLAVSHGAQAMRFHVGIGTRYPTLASASGRCFAAYSGIAIPQLSAAVRMLHWSTRPTISAWRKEVLLTRMRGFAIDENHYVAGATALAVPVLDGAARIQATVAAIGPSEVLDAPTRAALVEQLQRTAARATTLLLT